MQGANTAPNQPESGETAKIGKPALHGGIWHFSVALLSALVPGAGQIVLGARRKGSLLLAAFFLFVIAIWPLRVMATYSGYVISVCTFLTLVLYSSCSALLAKSQRTDDRPSRWWLLLFVPLAITLLALDYGVIVRTAGFQSFSIPSTSMEQTLVPRRSYYRRHTLLPPSLAKPG
jgi:hypothetical protein